LTSRGQSPTAAAATFLSPDFHFIRDEVLVKNIVARRWCLRAQDLSILLTLLVFACATSIVATAQTSIFSIQSSPSPNVQGNTLNAIASLSSSDAWAVGYMNDNNLNESRTLTMHWDGGAWTVVKSPNPGSIPSCTGSNTGNFINAVSMIAANDVWAVGFSFTCSGPLKPMALHWDGVQWNVVPTPKLISVDNAALNGVLALASNNVYAVGYHPASNGAVKTLIEHWDGTSWKVMASPNANQTGNFLWALSATSPTDIWAVGDRVAPNIPVKTLVEHFDGTKWTIVPSPNPVGNGDLSANVLSSVQAVSPTDVTAVGFIRDSAAQRTLTLIEHWDGTQWKVVPSPNQGQAAGDLNVLNGVTEVSATDLYAAGYFENAATGGQHRTMVQHFDGVSWKIIPSPAPALAQQLHGVFAQPGAPNVWTVGASSTFGIDFEDGFLQVPQTLVLFSPIG
jgi:hypothetical protein